MRTVVRLEMLRDDVADYRHFVEACDYVEAMRCFERIGPGVRKCHELGYSVKFISEYADLHQIAVLEHLKG
jgi:hypothetical protein